MADDHANDPDDLPAAGAADVTVLYREDQRWVATPLDEELSEDLDGLIDTLRHQPGEGGALIVVNVADEFFVVARLGVPDARLLLSDITAAASWELADQVCERLGVPTPSGAELDDVHPVGDLAIFADLGLPPMELGLLLGDVDDYADEQIRALAARLGFTDAYDHVVGSARR